MGWTAPAIQSLQKELPLVLKSFAILIRTAAIFIYYIIKNTPSDVESREEQDGSKHKVVGGTTAKLWPHLHQGIIRKRNENESLAEEPSKREFNGE